MKRLFPLVLFGLFACGPNIDVDGLGEQLSQDDIRTQIIDQKINFTAPATESTYRAQFTLLANGGITFHHPPTESGTWTFPKGTTDICLRFVVRFGGGRSCFGISALPDGRSFVTNHGYLIQMPRTDPSQ
ncbi:MAG: hypothetical protein AAF386_06510 [Pseudomonadota bacterium]